jgi:GNAT superfamily N-acetyltransferase
VGIEVRPVVSDADYAAWRHVRMVVIPYERVTTAEEMRALAGSGQRYFLAELDGELAGSGVVGKSNLAASSFVAPRVLPPSRRRGVGSALLRVLAREAVAMGYPVAGASVDDPGSLVFAGRFGFHEVDRQVEQVRAIGDEPPPAPPAGVTIVAVSARPELWTQVYETVAAQAFRDMPTTSFLEVTPEQWQRDWISDPDAMFVALAGEEVIGCAGLMPDPDQPHRAEHALTAIRRDWRKRGVASALKRTTLHWAASHGFTEVYTWTQRGNDDMRALNTHLGYLTRTESISVRAALPLAE